MNLSLKICVHSYGCHQCVSISDGNALVVPARQTIRFAGTSDFVFDFGSDGAPLLIDGLVELYQVLVLTPKIFDHLLEWLV